VSCKQSRHSVIMEEWNGRQRAFAIKMFYKTDDSLEAAQREFRRIFQLGRIVFPVYNCQFRTIPPF
jgi:hypothetical protein